MTITCLPMDATAGEPDYTAQNFRQAQAAQHGGGSGRRLGGRSGFRVDTPSNVLTASSTTWTLGPCAAMIDPGASTHQGMYGWSSDANTTGAVTAADATYARKDIVYIRISDSSAGDGSGALSAPVLYLAGDPGAAPVAPALPSRSFLVGTITVPASGGGSPTVVLNPARYVAAGAPVPVDLAARDALSKYSTLQVIRTDLAGRPVETWDGSKWVTDVSVSSFGTGAGRGSTPPAGTKFLMQAGSTVIPTEVNGYGTINLTPFPNGIISATVTNGDLVASGRGWSAALNNATTSALFVNLSNGVGDGFGAGQWRCDWVAIGW